jgi:hypothetical protein
LPRKLRRLLPQLTAQAVVREPLDLLSGGLGVAVFNRFDDPSVQLPTAIAQQAAICHLMGQRVLEGVLGIGKEACLVEELGGLQAPENAGEPVRGQIGHGL